MQTFQTGEPRPPNPSAELRALIRSGEAGRLRSAARISQGTMAEGLGISRPYMSRAENGRQVPSAAVARRWLRVLRGLQRHEAVTAEIAANWRRGAA